MASQEIWVHGNSGQIQVVKKKWGTAEPTGSGLYLEGNVQKSYEDEPWVQFHIPMTSIRVEESSVQLPRLQQVMLRFSTDCNKADSNPPYKKTNLGFEKWPTDSGGAIVTQLHVYDGEGRIAIWDGLDWQSTDLNQTIVMTVTLTPEREIHWGLGVSVRVWFKNQFFIAKRLTMDKSQAFPPLDPDWDEEPWLNKEAATESKNARLFSVGCRVSPAKP